MKFFKKCDFSIENYVIIKKCNFTFPFPTIVEGRQLLLLLCMTKSLIWCFLLYSWCIWNLWRILPNWSAN